MPLNYTLIFSFPSLAIFHLSRFLLPMLLLLLFLLPSLLPFLIQKANLVISGLAVLGVKISES